MFDGLNLGLAVRIADNASVNANKITSSIDRLMKMSQEFAGGAKKTGTAVDHLATDFDKADHGARKSGAGIHSFTNDLNRATPNIVDFRAGIIRLFPYVSVLGGVYAVKRGFDDIIATTRELTYSLANMQAAAGYSNSEMKMLENGMRSMSNSGRFSMKEISDASYDLSTTIPIASEQLGGLTKSVMDYATATQYSVKESGLDMLALLSKLGRPLTDSTILFDQMAKATNVTSMTAQRLSEMLKVTGTEAAGANVSFSEMLALMGNTDLYYKGSEGGTRLRMMFQQLAMGTEHQKKLLAGVGLTTADVDISKRGVFNVLDTMGKMTYGELSRLVGGYSAGLMMRLTKDTKKMRELSTQLTEEGAKGTTARMAEIQFNTLDGQIVNVANRLNNLKVIIGESLERPMVSTLKKIGNYWESLQIQFTKNKPALDAIADFGGRMVDRLGASVSGWLTNVLRWTGLVSDSREQSMNQMKNHLIPLLVFLEIASIRIGAFVGGAWKGFTAALDVAWNILRPMVGEFGNLSEMFSSKSSDMETYGRLIGVIAGAWMTISVATKAATAAQWLYNAAVAANPIVLFIAAITGLVVALYSLRYTFLDLFRWLAEKVDLLVNNLVSMLNPMAWIKFASTGQWTQTNVSNLAGMFVAPGTQDEEGKGALTQLVKSFSGGSALDGHRGLFEAPIEKPSYTPGSRKLGPDVNIAGKTKEQLSGMAHNFAKYAMRGEGGNFHFGNITIVANNPEEFADKLTEKLVELLPRKLEEKKRR